VHKSQTADLVEGGVAGAVNIETRKPLEFRKPFTAELSAQAIYTDLARKTDPQLNALFNWKNDAGTGGVLFQVFSEKRHERRDGQEIFGYGAIDPASPAAIAHPELAGVLAPAGINSALFEQTRKRDGGVLDIQFKPSADVMLDFNGFYSKLDAANYNRSFYNQPLSNINAVDGTGAFVGVVPTAYTISNNTLTSATFSPAGFQAPVATGPTNGQLFPGVVDQIYRPGSGAETYYLDFNGSYRASVVALAPDGQTSSQALGSALPPSFLYTAPDSPEISINPPFVAAGTEAMIEILGSRVNFLDSETAVGFGSSDIQVRRIWVMSNNRLIVNVAVAPSAAPGLAAVTVSSGLALIRFSANLQIQPFNSRQVTLRAPVVNQANGLRSNPGGVQCNRAGISAGAVAGAVGDGVEQVAELGDRQSLP
jgi:hypothetical protein